MDDFYGKHVANIQYMEYIYIWILYPRDPGSPSENGFMEPKYAEEMIVHPNHQLRI